jgi:chemotaxis protein methyltransferase CheR
MSIARVAKGGEPSSALGDVEFAAWRELVESASGIHLADHKRALLVGRLSRRVRELGLDGFEEYLARVRSDPAELVEMLDRICTNETRFFREPQHFELLERRFLGELGERARARGDVRIRAWSAACSTGEEPYSLAMSMRVCFGAGGPLDVEVVGTDLSTRALER